MAALWDDPAALWDDPVALWDDASAPPVPPGPETDPPITAEAVTIADLSTVVGTFPLMEDYGWLVQRSDVGSFVLTLNNLDPARAFIVTPNTLINFYLFGTLAATGWFENRDTNELATDEEPEETSTYRGRLHGGLVDLITLDPPGGLERWPIADDRNFNYTDPAYDSSAWVTPTNVSTVLNAQTNWAGGTDPAVQWDPDFPDPGTIQILWASDGTDTDAGVGDCYYIEVITAATTGTHALVTAADNYGEVYIDGQPMATPGQESDLRIGFTRMTKQLFDLTAGDHLLAAKCTNAPGASPNPAGIAWAVYESNALGQLDTLIAYSNTTDVVMLEYQTQTPGMTPGAAIIAFLAEAAARAGVDPLAIANLVTVSFTVDEDTAGTPWPVTADMATKVGRTLLEFLRELAETYIDWRMRPGTLILDVWVKDGQGDILDVNYERGTTLTSHNEKEEG